MAASCGPQSGMSMTRVARPISDAPIPSPSRATAIGRPAATNVPNVTSRMITAAARPTASDVTAAVTIAPPTSTRWPGALASSARSSTRWASAIGIDSDGSRSRPMVPNAVRPSGETCVNGSATPSTPGTSRTCSSRSATSARTSGAVTGPSVRTTRSMYCPASAGKVVASSSCAWSESEPCAA
jgi:hypothetical protein